MMTNIFEMFMYLGELSYIEDILGYRYSNIDKAKTLFLNFYRYIYGLAHHNQTNK